MSQYYRGYTYQKILESAENGASESKIRSDAHLTSIEVNKYLHKMIENDLIGYDTPTRIYKTTGHGEDFLKTIKEVGYFLSFAEK